MFKTANIQKTLKWIFLLAAFMFIHKTRAYLSQAELKAKIMDLQLMRWLSKAVGEHNLEPQLQHTLSNEYGKQGTKLLPTLLVVNKREHLPRDARAYHLFILHKATTMKKVGPGLALLQIKLLAFLHAINYTNCMIYSRDHYLPNIRYCKELGLAFLDVGLMGTEVLCAKIADLFVVDSTKSIFNDISKVMYKFENSYRYVLEKPPKTKPQTVNPTDKLRAHVTQHSAYFQKLVEGENKMLPAFQAVNKFIWREKSIGDTFPSMESVARTPLKSALETWLKAETVYENSKSPSGELDLMKALINAETEVITQFKMCDEDAMNQLKSIQEENFRVEENAIYEKIVIVPEKEPDLITF